MSYKNWLKNKIKVFKMYVFSVIPNKSKTQIGASQYYYCNVNISIIIGRILHIAINIVKDYLKFLF